MAYRAVVSVIHKGYRKPEEWVEDEFTNKRDAEKWAKEIAIEESEFIGYRFRHVFWHVERT